jgi:hypothetical protein
MLFVILRRVAPVRTDDSDERRASIIRATRIGELCVTQYFFAACISCLRCSYFTDYFHPCNAGATFLRNFGSYTS